MYFFHNNSHRRLTFKNKGFTLIESLVGAAVFAVIAISVFQTFSKVFEVTSLTHTKIIATTLVNEQFEIARNLPYTDVGVVNGIPDGKIPHTQSLTRDGITFEVTTTIRNIDDAFDGTIGGSPNDLSPADYKLVEIEINCVSCRNFRTMQFNAFIGPKNLEGSSTNGALFVRVSDANGQPISGVSVHIVNNQEVPAIVIDDTTNTNGLLQIVDVPPANTAYEITVSKSGYSSDQTYTPGDIDNPNPVNAHATIAAQQVTQVSFAIEKTSTISLASVTQSCTTIGSIDFTLDGTKLIGISPDILKFSTTTATRASGLKTLSGLEWDTYVLSLIDSTYDLVGSIPLLAGTLSANTTQDLKLIVAPKNPKTLLVTVKDASGLPLSDAVIELGQGSATTTRTTGNGFLTQTDWAGGSGQENFVDEAQYLSSDGNIETSNPAGELRLKKIFSDYVSAGTLTSSTLDTGSSSNFHQILWQPTDQAPQVGTDSVRFQIATNNDNTTWIYLGPDGTTGTYYTLANGSINDLHNGDRYLRYKIFLQTADVAYTPNVADISVTFTSSCVPPGQVAFSGLTTGSDYAITITKSGYQVYNETGITVSSAWQQKDVVLVP